MVITLIGYRGSGKSSVAPELAARLGWAWADADHELEQTSGRTIREIFAEGGEPEFRAMERQTLQRLLQRDRLVLAAGGGAILNPATRNDFRSAGPVVWLQASVELLMSRIEGDATTASRRPSLTGQSVSQEVASLLKAREPLYRETSTIMIPTDGLSVVQITDQILAQCPDSLRNSVPSPGDGQ